MLLLRSTHTDVNDETCNNDGSIEAMEFGFEETKRPLALIHIAETTVRT